MNPENPEASQDANTFQARTPEQVAQDLGAPGPLEQVVPPAPRDNPYRRHREVILVPDDQLPQRPERFQRTFEDAPLEALADAGVQFDVAAAREALKAGVDDADAQTLLDRMGVKVTPQNAEAIARSGFAGSLRDLREAAARGEAGALRPEPEAWSTPKTEAAVQASGAEPAMANPEVGQTEVPQAQAEVVPAAELGEAEKDLVGALQTAGVAFDQDRLKQLLTSSDIVGLDAANFVRQMGIDPTNREALDKLMQAGVVKALRKVQDGRFGQTLYGEQSVPVDRRPNSTPDTDDLEALPEAPRS